MNCPRCGNPLRSVALSKATPPWLCHECHRGWWNAELTPAARDAYRYEYHDFGADHVARQIHRDREDEAGVTRG